MAIELGNSRRGDRNIEKILFRLKFPPNARTHIFTSFETKELCSVVVFFPPRKKQGHPHDFSSNIPFIILGIEIQC